VAGGDAPGRQEVGSLCPTIAAGSVTGTRIGWRRRDRIDVDPPPQSKYGAAGKETVPVSETLATTVAVDHSGLCGKINGPAGVVQW